MKQKHTAIATEVPVVPRGATGSRDAVETAIDSAKDGNAWESNRGKIAQWEPYQSDYCRGKPTGKTERDTD